MSEQTPQDEIAALLQAVSGGDRPAFDRLFGQTSARLHALCVSILKDRPLAEDVLEETYLQVCARGGEQAVSGLSPMTWLVLLTRETAISRLRSEGGTPPVTRPSPLQAIWLEGASPAALSERDGVDISAVRARVQTELAEWVEMAASETDPDDTQDSLIAAEWVLGILPAAEIEQTRTRLAQPDFANRVTEWRERLSGLALSLTPVMTPARTRQRLREKLGHAKAPLEETLMETSPGRDRWLIWLLFLLAVIAGLWWLLS